MKVFLSRFYLYFYSFYFLFVGFAALFIPRWGMNYLGLQYSDTVLTHSYGIIMILIGLLAILPAIDFGRYFLNFIIVAAGAIMCILQYLFEWFIGSAGLMQLGVPFLVACGYVYCGYLLMVTNPTLRK